MQDTRDVAAKFRLSLAQIREAAEVATITAATRGAPSRAPRTSTSARATRPRRGSASSPRGSTPRYRWNDLVLPERQRELLRRSPPTCATATACSPSGATRGPSRAPRA